MSNLSPFGGGKNPPWVRNAGQGIQNIQQQMLGQAMGSIGGQPMVQYQQQTQQVYQQSLGLQQPNITMASMATLGSNLPSGIAGQLYPQVATVSYPTPRALNTNAFQPSVAGVPQQVQQNVPSSSTKQRVFTGTVTKVHDNFGFVDEDVFFQTSACVKGSNPVVGDRVLVEASYNPSMPFKWNATRIQVLPMGNNSNSANTQQTNQPNRQQQQQQQQPNRTSGTYNAVPPPTENPNNRWKNIRFTSSTTNSNSTSNRNKVSRVRERSPRERRNDDEEIERKRRREERIREREKKEDRSPSRTRRSKSPRPRRRTRVVPRYMVQIPKIALDLPEADVLEIRRRYQNMYIPSDFFSTNFRWVDAFPPHMPFTLNKPCSFHVMHKDVDPCNENTAVLEPSDADYLFSAKVMLISMPAMEEIYKRCCGVSEDRDPDRDYVHPTRLINFLVGLRGKNETMAIGGPWSPSLDGPNPEKDPSVLIRTAVRTCKALTGIDLSSCTQWYRFLELYYRRAETTHKSGRVVPSRVETVILFLPDVWSCVPTRLEWDGLQLNYKKQLERKLLRAASNPDDLDAANETDEAAAADQKDDSMPEKKDPTHYSELDPKSMNVNELRQELAARNLSSKGLKSQLLARLLKAVKSEQAKEEGRQDEADENEEDVPPSKEEEDKKFRDNKDHDEDKRKLYERERTVLEKRYTLPDSSHIIVHPSRMAKSGKFDCTVMSLSVLLDYRPEDTKEHSFEVSLFAELFNEMLMRDFGFRIYRSLSSLPEKTKEKDEDKKKDKKDDKRDDKKDDKRKEDEKKSSKKDEKRDDKKREEAKDKKDDKDAKCKIDDKDREKEKNDDEEEDEDDESDDDDSVKDGRRDRDKDGKKRKIKLYTHDPYLLLSFVYFDQTHCGYIFDKDIEELIYTLGLNLSRAQVRKLVQKVVTRDSLHYRKLTDKSKEDDLKDEKKDDKESDKGESAKGENEEDILRSLALGNKKLLPVFVGSGPPSKRARREDCILEKANEETIPEGIVMYKGSLLDVEKLVSQLKRSEKARLDTEDRMMELQHELTVVNEKSVKQTNSIKGLSEDLKMYKDKLRSSDEKLKKTSTDCHTYLTAIKNMYHVATKALQSERKVEVVEIQDEKVSGEINGSEMESKFKTDTRWGDNKVQVKKEPIDVDKDKKSDNKTSIKREIVEADKEKK
ncbi:PREDICTED: cell division cycle and apoptosis regulator protein 1-like isoform X1 [Acromyrmex echinatior]|uniref:cell division cycle and apoptosis regulator protein 1-like isoform X1 n=1 Tax=Acromyrmex echinatior TaxID=103372 RepID=UPI0005810223|nr:PREDICTED: cell division cycle and apoptosis regulator protein 1-like isoform X1 [Acromyrmex echinatior]